MTESDEQVIRILVVDDEAIVQSLISDALEEEGYDIETASSGPDALELIRQHPIDLLITDIRMPGMDGIELVTRAREMHPSIGVIFMTGYANLNSAKDAIKQGAFDYIMKPFELNEIRQAVGNAIKARRDAEETGSNKEINRLSDLSAMLFATGDRKSLITSSLKFAMMYQRAEDGSALFFDEESDNWTNLSIHGNRITEQTHPKQPLYDVLKELDLKAVQEPRVIFDPEDHPIQKLCPGADLQDYFKPEWLQPDEAMVLVPVVRSDLAVGCLMLRVGEDTARIKEANLKFLAITASQLAITLENLSLLEETRRAYSHLKELQDETIDLEKMATRGQMSAEIGHELNNFVGVVAGNLSLLEVHLQRQDYDKLDRYVTAMTDTIGRIKQFTTSLMDLTPISSEKEFVYFDRLIKEVIEYLKPQRRYRDVLLLIEKLPEDIPFEADATQIQQLLYNLFNNAADATLDRDTREISVLVDRPPDSHLFSMTIRDTGSGIEPELLEKAFREKFTTKKSGHGFGLVVCNQIIERHGGRLRVDSSPGVGTAITVEFPLAHREEPVLA